MITTKIVVHFKGKKFASDNMAWFYMYSKPTYIGAATIDGNSQITVDVLNGEFSGVHTLAAFVADGELLVYGTVEVVGGPAPAPQPCRQLVLKVNILKMAGACLMLRLMLCPRRRLLIRVPTPADAASEVAGVEPLAEFMLLILLTSCRMCYLLKCVTGSCPESATARGDAQLLKTCVALA
ncbi:MAG: hypothetical protein LBP35_01100 [Candidatus Ancillula trichonymphae]|nr:hypothetical protein [Candidatus Ancillula trichonymphae]